MYLKVPTHRYSLGLPLKIPRQQQRTPIKKTAQLVQGLGSRVVGFWVKPFES